MATENTVNLTNEELVQIQRALHQRRKEFRNTADTPTYNTIRSAVQKVAAALHVEEVTEESAPPKPRRTRTSRKTADVKEV